MEQPKITKSFINKFDKMSVLPDSRWTLPIFTSIIIGGAINPVGALTIGVSLLTSFAVLSLITICKTTASKHADNLFENHMKKFDVNTKVKTMFNECVKSYNLKDWSERRKYTFVGEHRSDNIDPFHDAIDHNNMNTSSLKIPDITMFKIFRAEKKEEEKKKKEEKKEL